MLESLRRGHASFVIRALFARKINGKRESNSTWNNICRATYTSCARALRGTASSIFSGAARVAEIGVARYLKK